VTGLRFQNGRCQLPVVDVTATSSPRCWPLRGGRSRSLLPGGPVAPSVRVILVPGPVEQLKLGCVVFTRKTDFETDRTFGGDFEARRLQSFGVEPLAQSAHGIIVTHIQRLRHEHCAGRAFSRHLVRQTSNAKVVELHLFPQRHHSSFCRRSLEGAGGVRQVASAQIAP
jgi:hypothetical protein